MVQAEFSESSGFKAAISTREDTMARGMHTHEIIEKSS